MENNMTHLDKTLKKFDESYIGNLWQEQSHTSAKCKNDTILVQKTNLHIEGGGMKFKDNGYIVLNEGTNDELVIKQ